MIAHSKGESDTQSHIKKEEILDCQAYTCTSTEMKEREKVRDGGD